MAGGKRLRAIAVLLGMVMLLCCTALPVFAASDVPQAVRDARQGVVRVLVTTREGLATGTGFAVGTDDNIHIITNYHVTESAETIQIFYDTDAYVEGEVLVESAAKDLCVLKPKERIPGIVALPLQTEEFDSGIAVYALGFPFAADTLSLDFEKYYKNGELTLYSDKNSITITDGIISAFRTSTIWGDLSSEVRAIQTNTSISGGNSGGPLLDKDGNVVGINTLSSNLDTNINASLHVSELISLLRSNGIAYGKPVQQEVAVEKIPEKKTNWVLWIGLSVAGAALLAAAIVLIVQRKKAKKQKGSVSLNDYLRGGR